MRALRLGAKIVSTLFRDQVYYPSRLFAETLIAVARCGILLLLYSYVFKLNGGSVANLSFKVAAWSIFIYFAILPLRLREVGRMIMRDVQTGVVEILFARPISYLAFRFWWQVGTGLYAALIICIFGAVLMAIFVGFPESMRNALFIPSLILTFFLGCILTLLLYSIVGILSFWIEDVNPLYWIVDKAVMILGGAYLPIGMFPPFMQLLARYSPFGATYFASQTVYDDWSQRCLLTVMIQLFWVVTCGSTLMFLYGRARARLSVNGG